MLKYEYCCIETHKRNVALQNSTDIRHDKVKFYLISNETSVTMSPGSAVVVVVVAVNRFRSSR